MNDVMYELTLQYRDRGVIITVIPAVGEVEMWREIVLQPVSGNHRLEVEITQANTEVVASAL